MKKLIILLGLVFLLCISVVSAVLTDAELYYSFDNVDISSSVLLDLSGNNNNGLISTTTGLTGILNQAFSFNGIDENLINGINANPSNSFSTSFWYKGNQTGNIIFLANREVASPYSGFFIAVDAGNSWQFQLNDQSNFHNFDPAGTVSIRDNDWHHIVFLYNSTTERVNIYLDGVVSLSNYDVSSVTGSILSSNNLSIGFDISSYNKIDTLDELVLYHRILSNSEVLELYNNGNAYNPYTVISDINDSTESTAVVKQVGSVSFSGGAPKTILSSNFNVSVNNTPLYGGYSFNIESNGVNTVFCELLIDGVSRANVTRTQQIGQLGSVFIQTPVFLIDEGSHTQTLRCTRQSGVGLLTVTNAVGIGHFLVNQDLEFLPYNTSTFTNEVVTSGTSYTLIDSFNITIGNKTEVDVSQNRTNHIVIENKITYNNLAGSTELLSAYMSVNGTNCSMYPRTVSSGSTGSVSMDCIIFNVTEEATYTINVYANGSNAQYTGNTVAKNFFLSEGEIIGGTGVVTGFPFSGSSWTEIINVQGGNLNHDVANAFTKLSYSLLTNISTQVDFYIEVSDGSTFTTNTWSRDFIAGQTGVLIGQDILESLPKDPDYNISLYARCGTGASCTITGGSSLGYLTDVITTVLNAFNVSVYDYWDNSTIFNFSVVDGGTWTTTTGSVFVFTENNPENLTITSDTHFTGTVLNHNTSNDLNVTLKNSDIKFRSYEIGSNDTITTTNFTIEGVTKAYNDSFYLKAGNYNVTVSGGGYYSRTQEINVSSLDNTTLRFDGDNGLGNTIFNITLTDYVTSLAIPNFSVVVTSNESYDYTFTESTTNGYINVIGVQNDTYLLDITSTGYASSYNNVLFNTNNYTAYDYLMFTYNSILINVFSATDFTLIQPQQVNISFIYSNTNFQNSTTTGQLYIDLLTPEDYELRFFTNGYNTVSKYLTVTNDSTQNVSIYLDTNETATQRFRVVDTSGNVVEGAVIRIQKEVLGFTENWVTVQETVTDSEGYCYGYIEKNPSIYYRFGVIVDGVFKPLSPSGNTFTTKTNFIDTFEETIQLVVDLEETTTSAIDVLDAITYDLSFSGDNDEYVNFTFADALSTIVGGDLRVYVEELNGSLNKTLVSTQTVYDFDGEITATLPVINNTRYTIEAYILFQNSNSLVDSRIITYEGDATIPANIGLFLGIVVMMFVMFITIILRPLLSIILTIGVLYPLTLFGIISIPNMIITSLIALGIILFVKIRGGNQQ